MSERRFQNSISDKRAIELGLEHTIDDGAEEDSEFVSHKTKIEWEAGQREVSKLVFEVDPRLKALTGRTPERLEEETGISCEELFPENENILYIGDPWQRMGVEIDDERMFVIDYEFGETAEFIDDEKSFFDKLLAPNYGIQGRLVGTLENWQGFEISDQKQQEWLNKFSELIEVAKDASSTELELNEFPRAADAWQKVREYIEETYHKEVQETEEELPTSPGDPRNEYDAFAEFRKEAWYAAVYAERGFRDIPDWQTKIKPKLDEYEAGLKAKGVTGEEMAELVQRKKKSFIDDIRLKKKPEHSHIIQAVFPELPFADESFGRIVASWSISAHAFSHLDRGGFRTCWNEIKRVLKPGGEAYIFPLTYEYIDFDTIISSLNAFAEETGMEWEMIDRDGIRVPENSEYLENTLLMKKPRVDN